jgi:flagella basal body P-ring formation protein FlgA
MNALLVVLVALSLNGNLTSSDVRRLLDTDLPRTQGADSLRWSLSAPWMSLKIPAGADGVRLITPRSGLQPGYLSCIVQLVQDDEVLRSASIGVRCDRVGTAVRLRRAVRAGEVLEASDLEQVWSVLPPGERPLEASAAAVNFRARRSLPEGAWLTAGVLQRAPLIKTGGPLAVVAASAGLQISFQATAQQEGGFGDVIRVRGPRPNSLLRARITGAGTAELVP